MIQQRPHVFLQLRSRLVCSSTKRHRFSDTKERRWSSMKMKQLRRRGLCSYFFVTVTAHPSLSHSLLSPHPPISTSFSFQNEPRRRHCTVRNDARVHSNGCHQAHVLRVLYALCNFGCHGDHDGREPSCCCTLIALNMSFSHYQMASRSLVKQARRGRVG